MIAILDGDVIKYACGFASDAEAAKRGLEYEDVSYCLNGVNKTIKSILSITGADEYVAFVSHPVNHRKTTYPDYKANRDPTHKPHWFEEIEHFLFKKHNAQWSDEGDEADDAMGILQCSMPSQTVICSIDKDLDCIPGWHYNFSKSRKDAGLYYVEEEDANRFFYKQILTGDTADNIPGMYKKIGKKASKRYTDPLMAMNKPADMFNHVVTCFDGDREWVEFVGGLLWIKRDESGVWVP